MRATTPALAVRTSRQTALRQILLEERNRVLDAVRLAIREGREEGVIESGEVQDEAEESEADAQSELEFALLQMQGETLARISDALDRLDAGQYGICVECDKEIPARRLEALPFATRCRDCEQAREADDAGRVVPPSWEGVVHLLGPAG